MESGNAANIIPETALIRGNMRAYTQEKRDFMKKRIVELSEGIAKAWRGEAKVEFPFGVAPNVNDKELTLEMEEYLEDVAQIEIIQPIAGSEDFANLCQYIPTFFANVGCGSPQDGYEYSMHNPKMRIDEAGLPYGTAAHCQCAFEYLAHHSK